MVRKVFVSDEASVRYCGTACGKADFLIICTLLHDMYISISYVHYSDEGIVVVEIKDLNYWATREGEDKEEKI